MLLGSGSGVRTERGRPEERGAALLTVLMLVAVIAVIASASLEKLVLTTRIAGNATAGRQAEGYARAAEILATTRITSLLGKDPSRVTLAGGWSGRPFGLPLPGGGSAIARVSDGGNCFNLNGLVVLSGPGSYANHGPARAQFARLLRLLNVGAQQADTIAAAASDWIDTDNDQQAGGAEDGSYLSLQGPHRTGGTLMADPSELRAVNGMTPDIYARVRPFLCTLPIAEPAKINIDTLLPEQAPLLAALMAENVPVETARQLILRRPPQGWADTGAFRLQANQAGIVLDDALGGAQISVTTGWFALTVDVTLGPAQRHERALVDARRLPARLVARQWGEGT
jgi:general secretion pathway protein K